MGLCYYSDLPKLLPRFMTVTFFKADFDLEFPSTSSFCMSQKGVFKKFLRVRLLLVYMNSKRPY